MFLECAEFYKFDDTAIHSCFISKLTVTTDDVIHKWHLKQIQRLQELAQLYALRNNKTGITLWSQIFAKLITLPLQSTDTKDTKKSMFAKLLPIISGENQEQKVDKAENELKQSGGNIFDDEDDHEKGKKMFLSSGDLEINPKHLSNEEAEEAMNPYFMIQLEYCISMRDWIRFAALMKHIPALRDLIVFVQDHLRTLNRYVSSKSTHMTMKHLEIFKENQGEIRTLVQDCEYSKYFSDDKMLVMIHEFDEYTNLKLYFIRFLARFTRQNEDHITKETHNFVQFIKNWDFEAYVNVKSRKEWNQWLHPNSSKLAFLFQVQTSNVFFNIWCGERRSIQRDCSVYMYMNSLYPTARKEWDLLIDRANKSLLTFDDVVWFEHLDLIKELNIMRLPQAQIIEIQKDIDYSLRIDDYVDFVDHLTKTVDIFVLNGKTQIRDPEDVNWKILNENLEIAKQTKDDKSQSIANIGSMYRGLMTLVGVTYNDIQKQWIKTVVVCKQTVYRMANDDHFKKDRFRETLQLLDDSNDGEMTQLSGSLRSTHRLFVTVWNILHKSKTDLMRFFASMEVKHNDLNNLRQIHDAIPRIKNIVAEVGKMAQDRDMQKLDNAMCIGYFNFDTQYNIQQIITETQQIAMDEIAKKCLHLNDYNVPEIQGMIDIILLSRNNTDTLYEDAQKQNVSYLKKRYGDETFMESLIQYMNDNGSTYTVRVKLMDEIRGEQYDTEALWDDIEDDNRIESNLSRIVHNEIDFKLMEEYIEQNDASTSSGTDQSVIEYIRKIDICKEISEWRIKYILNGGRMRDDHNKIERIKASSPMKVFNDKQKEWQRRVLHWSEYVLQLRNESHLFNYYTINQIRLIISKLNQYKNLYQSMVFEELMGLFRFARPDLKGATLRDLINNKWKIVDENSDEALLAFNQCFDTTKIMNIYNYCKKEIRNKSNEIANGRPNLLITKKRSDAIFAALNLYYSSSVQNDHTISSHQVLVCDKSLSSEDIFIFVFRCLQNEKRFRYNRVHQIPIYCLLFPEDLDIDVLDETVNIFNQYLLSKIRKSVHYTLMVISCVENNTLCHRLTSYRTSLSLNISDDLFVDLFNGHNDNDILNNNKLFVQLYQSGSVGLGKSYMIQQMARKTQKKRDLLIRIPFNSPVIDLDFVVDRLYKCCDGKKRKKIIYHIDISSSATSSVNFVLFSLLFLRYIRTSRDRFFSVKDNMVFLIEEPTDLASLKYKTIENEFYILHSPMKYPTRIINHKTNPFLMNNNAHYAAKFLYHFYSNDLKRDDPDPRDATTHQVSNVPKHQLDRMMRNNFRQIPTSSPIRQKAFWEYLYTQFVQVVHSTVLRNEWHKDNNEQFNQWKHLVTESIIDLAEDFSKKLYTQKQKYHVDDEKKYSNLSDESDGTEHFHLTQKWQRRTKPIVLLNQSVDGSISFLVSDIYKIQGHLKQALDYQKFDLLGWAQQGQNDTKQDKIRLLLNILGTNHVQGLFADLLTLKPYCDYALTFDNMLKMIAIFFRVKANIPVILMGETGCGKTCLLNYLAKAANIEIERADVHGGFTAEHIRLRMIEWIQQAQEKLSQSEDILAIKLEEQTGDMNDTVEKQIIVEQITAQHEMQQMDNLWIFFDEVNTSPDIGYFKEIVCDGYFDGEALPKNMKVIAACNPYRRRRIQNNEETSILNDPLSQYMYRVYPLPNTMKEYVWMFGSLSERDEKAYTQQMTLTATNTVLRRDSEKEQLSKCIVLSQAFVRRILRDSAMVSLRDIARCLKIFLFLYESSNNFERSMIEALALVYYFRLNDDQRALYSRTISENIRKFYSTLVGDGGIIDKFCSRFKDCLPKGIALNRSLKENLFLLFICIETKTPLILVGKPGSSKTLAMSIIRDYLSDYNRKALKKETLLPIHVVSFQCSAQSRADGIKQRWEQTQEASQQNKGDVIYVLLLDEIGLAEHSPYRPLKVLHQLLEIDPPPISFIGLSNWSLDASKMNRAICHLCPIHKIDDLNATGRAMAKAYAQHDIDKLHPMISLLSNVYTDVMRYENCIQPRYDFFGARDFYSVVRHFLTAKCKENKVYDQNEELIMYFLRNFGGINFERINGNMDNNKKGTSLHQLLCKHMALNPQYITESIHKYAPYKLIELNLNDKRSTHQTSDLSTSDNFMISRHIMAITEYYNSWNILLDLNIINYDNIFIFGSEFERDKANIYLYLNKVKNCMETGKTLILISLEEIHESLYDMLNQRYTFVKTSNKMYCRIALGSNSQTCFVDPSFKCIVISPKFDAHRKGGVPIAFLNRFEKQLISYYSSLSKKHKVLLKQLEHTICKTYSIANIQDIKNIFPGFCRDTLSSLILNKVPLQNVANINKLKDYSRVNDEEKDVWIEEHKYNTADADIDATDIINKCMDTLSDVTLPEALIQSAISHTNGDVSYLPTLQSIMEQRMIHQLLIILTYDFAAKLETNIDFLTDNTMIKRMNEFSKSEEFELFIHKYLRRNDNKKLLLQYKHRYDGMNHFMHIKHIIETAIYKHHHRVNSQRKKITILVHLRRTKCRQNEKKRKKQYVSFPLILSESSKTVFLDSLSQKEPIKLNEFANQTIQDICKRQGIDLLKSIFQRSLSHLVFPQKINVENEIKKLSEIFDDVNDNPLQKCILQRFIKLMSDNKINRNIAELVGNVAITNTQWSRGSFYERLYDIIDTICVVAMMRVLQSLYENDNIDTIYNAQNKDIINVFIELYSNFDLIEIDAITASIESIVESRPNKVYIKYDYSASFPFSKTIHDWCNSQKTKLNMNNIQQMQEANIVIPTSNIITIAQNLKRELNAAMPSILNDLSIDVIELYANDMIFLNSYQLQIDKTWPKPFFQLISKYIMVTTLFFCKIQDNDLKISIAELESTVLHKHQFLSHLIKISRIFPMEYISNKNITYSMKALVNVVDLLLTELIYSSDAALSQQYQVNSIRNSLKYIIGNMQEYSGDDMKCDKEMEALYTKCNVCHIKNIAVKNNLNRLNKTDIDTLFVILNQQSLCKYNTFKAILVLLMKFIPIKHEKNGNNVQREKTINQILYDLLISIDTGDINKCTNLIKYAQFLIDLLCKHHKIIGNDAKSVKWDKDTEYEITKQLFLVLSHDSIQTSKLIKEIQQENSELSGMIIQSMSRDKGKKSKKVKSLKYVHNKEAFNKKLTIRAPLIKQFNPEIYDQAMNSITIKNFFDYFEQNKLYPVLSHLNQEKDAFWNIDTLPDIAQWIKLIHSKYIGTLSEQSCREFMMNDVFKQCKLRKWGDQNEWKTLFAKYKQYINDISFDEEMKLPPSNVKTSISWSLIAHKSGNKQIENNLESIQRLIYRNNRLIKRALSKEKKQISLFDLRKEDLIHTEIILDIIKSNAKLWICYDPRDKISPETYIIFDLERIEHQIQNQCIFGRKQLRIKYPNFQFVGSKNMLKLIQSIKLQQELLNYEIWHLFDKQFESNIQRKRALNVVEDVIALVSSSKGNIENDKTLEFFDAIDDAETDDKEEGKDDEKGNENLATQFMKKVFGGNRYNENEEIWHFMKHKLKIRDERCNLFKIENDDNSNMIKRIQLKHIQSLWNQLIKRIDGEMIQYEDQCYICYESIQEMTPIALECCGLNLHYECLKHYIQSGFGNNGTRITLKQLSCLMCRHPMKHKAANELFRATQVLYNKVKKVALKQLEIDARLNDAEIKNRDGEYYGNPAAYSMKLYAFFLCYRCKNPYFFGAKQCGDNMEEQNTNRTQRLCEICSEEGLYKKYKEEHKVQTCPKCKRSVEKIAGCDHITCICGTHWCYICGQAFSPDTIYGHIGTHG